MEKTATCACGSLRVTVTGDPAVVNVCHCQSCQRRTGSVMHVGVYFLKPNVRAEGPETLFVRDAEEGGRKIRFRFCPTCGSTVYWDADLRPDYFGLGAGSFAEPGFPTAPTYSVWEEFKHHWVNLPETIQHYPGNRPTPAKR